MAKMLEQQQSWVSKPLNICYMMNKKLQEDIYKQIA